MLIRLYTFYADQGKDVKQDPEAPRVNGHMNGSTLSNGHAHQPFSDRQQRQQLRDAEEFELEGLMSDDDDPAAAKERSALHP